ncbi:MAG: peptidylprolyl isomerase [Bacteroidales bacterium]
MLNRIRILLTLVTISIVYPGVSQGQDFVVDQIIGVVGDKIIKQSDIETQYLQLIAQGYRATGDIKCQILESMLEQKLMVNQAEIDSIEISESNVQLQLNSRLNHFIEQIGSEEELEEYFGKSILEIKEDFSGLIREQMLTERMQQEIAGNVSITPSEVKSFYKNLNKDSIPKVESKVEIQQLLIYPEYSDEAIFHVKERLLELRKRILEGESFATLAVLYSEDPSSASRGGEIGFTGKGDLDPAYAEAAFTLKEGSVSKIVESEFGYHIIQLIERRNEKVNTRHILLKPKLSPEAKENAINKLDSLARLIKMDSLTFEKAVFFHSDDEDTKLNGGVKINSYTGTSKFELEQLTRPEYLAVRDLDEGEISQPFADETPQGKKVYKIIKLKLKTDPHIANLEEDYNLLKSIAIENKKSRILENWLDEKLASTHVRIDEDYANCKFQNDAWLNARQ